MRIGLIFDWDGVVVDSSAAHERSWELLAQEEGKILPSDHFKSGFGRKNSFIIPEILDWTHDPAEIDRLALRKERLYQKIIKKDGIEPLLGVRGLLESAKAAGIPCAVGSSTPRENITLALKMLDFDYFFNEIVSAEDVTEGKPDPEVFVKAAALIHRRPRECVVFEDSFAGLQAARSGGMKSVAVATTNPLVSLRDKADIAVENLRDINLLDLYGLFR